MSKKLTQYQAIDKIHKIEKDAKMCIFILCDEDLQIYENEKPFTPSEKNEIYEQFKDAMLEQYGDILSEIVSNVIDNR